MFRYRVGHVKRTGPTFPLASARTTQAQNRQNEKLNTNCLTHRTTAPPQPQEINYSKKLMKA